MDTIGMHSIVVATDLEEASDRLVRTASAIAALTDARLHVVHVHALPSAPHPDESRGARSLDEATLRLDEQVERAIPSQFRPSSQMVIARAAPSEAIRQHAEELSGDLIVIGPHRGGLDDRAFLGTTADRLVSTAGVPCLIVRDGPSFPVQRVGVLMDFSPASQGALDTATAWMLAFSGGDLPAGQDGPAIHVGHVAWVPRRSPGSGEAVSRLSAELDRAIQRSRVRMGVTDELDFESEVLLAGDATQVVADWVRDRGLSMLVLGTRGRSRLPHSYLGGLASALARSAPCSVLLVPPDYAPEALREAAPESVRLRRVVTGVDFHDSSWEAALWAMRHFAPDAEHELIHVVHPPELPGPLRAFGGKREQLRLAAEGSAHHRLEELRELGSCPSAVGHVQSGRPGPEILRLATEVDADLIIVGEQGPAHGIHALLGSTAERVLFESNVPVLVARKVADSPPRNLLVAIDASEAAGRVLDWAGALLERFDARATVINVVDRLLLADELTGMPEADALRELEKQTTTAMREWLAERVAEAGVPTGRVQTRIAVGDPSYEIIAEADRSAADLVMVGSRGNDIARTALIGRIVNKVVRSAPCSVLVVPSRV